MTNWIVDNHNYHLYSKESIITDAACKPAIDTVNALLGYGFKPLLAQRFGQYDPHAIVREVMKVESGDIVVYPHPAYISGADHESIFIDAVHERGGRIIGYLFDINPIRFATSDEQNAELIETLNKYDGLIAQGNGGRQWLREHGLNMELLHKTVTQDKPWGYSTDTPYNTPELSRDLMYFGNMSEDKVGFLRELVQELEKYSPETRVFTPYHDLQDLKDNPHIIEFPNGDHVILDSFMNFYGGFGLVHDGNNTEQGERYSEYNKLSWSYKLSCYLASGFPICVRSDSAYAPYVRETKCGFIFDDMFDLSAKISDMSPIHYNEYVEGARTEMIKVRSSYYVVDTVLRAIEILK